MISRVPRVACQPSCDPIPNPAAALNRLRVAAATRPPAGAYRPSQRSWRPSPSATTGWSRRRRGADLYLVRGRDVEPGDRVAHVRDVHLRPRVARLTPADRIVEDRRSAVVGRRPLCEDRRGPGVRVGRPGRPGHGRGRRHRQPRDRRQQRHVGLEGSRPRRCSARRGRSRRPDSGLRRRCT